MAGAATDPIIWPWLALAIVAVVVGIVFLIADRNERKDWRMR